MSEEQEAIATSTEPPRRAYEAPRVTSQASLEQVTLFSGTVTVDGGVIGVGD